MIMLKKTIIALTLIVISAVGIAQSDYAQFTRDIRRYSDSYTDNQVVELYEYHYGVPQNTLRQLYGGFGFDWGNVTLGLEISNHLGVPIANLLGVYRQYPEGNGWGVMAQQYGIKPGSREFHQMKAVMSKKNSYWRDVYNDYGVNRNPSVARRNRVYIDKDLIRIGIPTSKEMKRINKHIEKRNKEIRKREEKTIKKWEKKNKKIYKDRKKRIEEIEKREKKARKEWEKENKKARKEREKRIKKQKKQIEKMGKWF